MSEIKFSILKNYGVLSVQNGGWQKEINLVSWNDRPARLDIREWNEAHDRMRKGITLTQSEAVLMCRLLSEIKLSDIPDEESAKTS